MIDPWLTYLANIPGELGEQARALWMQIAAFYRAAYDTGLPAPHAGSDESLSCYMMTWDSGPHHFEVEITVPGTSCEWFYSHQESGRLEGGEEGLGALAIELLLHETTRGLHP